MALVVYTNKKDVEDSGRDLVMINDLFFDFETVLDDSDLVRLILSTIDKASYNSSLTFIGRTKELGALNKNMLSTGTKTLLNIIQHPNKCFSVCECGNNVLSLLPLITEGSIYWSIPVVAYNGDSACDIICNNKEYKNFYEFLESVGD